MLQNICALCCNNEAAETFEEEFKNFCENWLPLILTCALINKDIASVLMKNNVHIGIYLGLMGWSWKRLVWNRLDWK